MSMYYIGDFAFDGMYLEHHGILGQKWGVRRYQNYDGSLTKAGRDRYYNKAEGSITSEGRKQFVKNTAAAYGQEGYGRFASKRLAKNKLDEVTRDLEKKKSERDAANEEYEKKLHEAEKSFFDPNSGVGLKYDMKMAKRLRERWGDEVSDLSDEQLINIGHLDDFGDDDSFNMFVRDLQKTELKDVTDKMASLNKEYRANVEKIVSDYINSDVKSIANEIHERDKRNAQALIDIADKWSHGKTTDARDSQIVEDSLRKNNASRKGFKIGGEDFNQFIYNLGRIAKQAKKEGRSLTRNEIKTLEWNLREGGVDMPIGIFINLLQEGK